MFGARFFRVAFPVQRGIWWFVFHTQARGELNQENVRFFGFWIFHSRTHQTRTGERKREKEKRKEKQIH